MIIFVSSPKHSVATKTPEENKSSAKPSTGLVPEQLSESILGKTFLDDSGHPMLLT